MNSSLLWIGLAILAGLLGSVHVPLNGALGVRVQSALVATFSFYGAAFLAIAALLLASGHRGSLAALRDVPPAYVVLPGLISVAVVGTNTYLIPRLGAVNLVVITVAAQLIGRAAISHFGWLASPVDPVTWSKFLGALLVAGGAFLVVRH
ncbi:MAG: DMT family transporter [Myxococcales bacterium]|nr:DMT family transporter [Myxococcales bacterium]